MLCPIVKEKIDCLFMDKVKGCTYNGGHCEPVVEACEGCGNIVDVEGELYCSTSASPAAKWGLGVCNYATHVTQESAPAAQKKINPLKAAKRAAAGR